MASLYAAISRYPVGILANQGVVLHLASIGISACLVTGCGAEDPPEPICNRAAYFSVVTIDLPGFSAGYGGELPLLLDVCPRGLECETVRMRPAADPAEQVDCSAEPGSSEFRCEIGNGGALQLQVQLPYPPEMLEDDRELEINLRREDGTPFAEAHAEMHMELQYGRGEECGVSHAMGHVDIDAGAWSAVP